MVNDIVKIHLLKWIFFQNISLLCTRTLQGCRLNNEGFMTETFELRGEIKAILKKAWKTWKASNDLHWALFTFYFSLELIPAFPKICASGRNKHSRIEFSSQITPHGRDKQTSCWGFGLKQQRKKTCTSRRCRKNWSESVQIILKGGERSLRRRQSVSK